MPCVSGSTASKRHLQDINEFRGIAITIAQLRISVFEVPPQLRNSVFEVARAIWSFTDLPSKGSVTGVGSNLSQQAMMDRSVPGCT